MGGGKEIFEARVGVENQRGESPPEKNQVGESPLMNNEIFLG